MKTISAKDLMEQSKQTKPYIIDVRQPDEFTACHLPMAVNIPLSNIEEGKYGDLPRDQTIYLVCQSGMRSDRARRILEAGGYTNLVCVEGGIKECGKLKGMVVVRKKVLPLMRQVQIAAGSLVVLGIVLSIFIHPAFKYLSLFVGCGLVFAGLTGFCGMAKLLEKMPWNKMGGT